MQKALGIILIAGIAVYLAACLGLFLVQRSLIYFPPSAPALGGPALSTLDAPGARLQISERPLAGRQAVIYFGGNAEDVSASLPSLALAFPEHALYLLHYRGFAGSSGKPDEAALVADALLLFDRVAARHPTVVLIGRSLGSGVAVQVASRRPVARLVLVTPFDSLQGLAEKQFPWFPINLLLKDKYESWRYAPGIKAPTLLLAAQQDEIVPAASTERLLARFAPGVAALRVLPGVGHNSIADSPAYLPALEGRLD
jgi:pimeloyl-ACP methyl ester carboxylesterase